MSSEQLSTRPVECQRDVYVVVYVEPGDCAGLLADTLLAAVGPGRRRIMGSRCDGVRIP